MRITLAAALIGACATVAGPASASSPPGPDPLRVALVAGGCAGCHGSDGRGAHGIPEIARTKTRAEFVAVMKSFRDDQRNPTVMNRIARGYSDEEFALMAVRYAKPE